VAWEQLRTVGVEGEFSIENEMILWLYEHPGASWDDEPQDHLYMISCSVREEIEQAFPGQFKFEELWSDNDSTGFTVGIEAGRV
jgi:hypothetical protein